MTDGNIHPHPHILFAKLQTHEKGTAPIQRDESSEPETLFPTSLSVTIMNS